MAKAHPYREWLSENRVQLEKLKSGRHVDNAVSNLEQKLITFSFGQEDIDRTIVPMATTGQEPVAAMGNDTPLAVVSERPQLLFNYFRQQFAQVTNPAIEPIREELVMSLTEYIGAVGCLFSRIARYTPLEHIKNLLKNNKTNALKSK